MDVRAEAHGLRTLRATAGLTAIYFALSELGLRWATVSGAASPVFPAAGAALAGLVLGGARLWPAVFLGRLAGALTAGAILPPWAELAIAAGNTLAAVAAAQALRRAGVDPALARLRDVLILVATAFGGSALAATVGTGTLVAALGQGAAPAGVAWLNWWAGDAAGVLVVTPLALAWARGEPVSRHRAWWLHLGASTAAAGGTAWLVFGPLGSPLLRSFLVFPALIWAALACGKRGAVTAMLPVAAVAVWGTAAGHGLLAAEAVERAAEPLRFVLLQQFVMVASMTALVLAVVADRLRDNEALRRSEERFRLSQERLRLAVAIAQMGTFEIDLRTDAVAVNEAGRAIYGWAPDEPLTFARVQTHFHPDDREEVMRRVGAAFDPAGPGEFEVEQRIVRADGAVRWIRVRGRAAFEPDGGERRAVRCVGTYLDVTAQKEAERERERLLAAERAARAEAERAGRMKDEFLATLSHELRTPLNAILGWAHILGRGEGNAAAVAKGMAAIERNAKAQAQLIDDLLDMSRIIAGQIRLELRDVDLREVIAAAADTVRPVAETKEIPIQHVFGPEAGPVRGDPHRLQQVVWNLLSNAVKFTPRGGLVRVALERVDNHVEVRVTDTGQGIGPEFLPFVFDRFRQADSSTTRRHSGLGLGLAIVKQIVELHGGRVRAASPGEGQGATFTVELPLR